MAEISVNTENGRSIQQAETYLKAIAAAADQATTAEDWAAVRLLAQVLRDDLALFHRAQGSDEGSGVAGRQVGVGEDRRLGGREVDGLERQPPQVA